MLLGLLVIVIWVRAHASHITTMRQVLRSCSCLCAVVSSRLLMRQEVLLLMCLIASVIVQLLQFHIVVYFLSSAARRGPAWHCWQGILVVLFSALAGRIKCRCLRYVCASVTIASTRIYRCRSWLVLGLVLRLVLVLIWGRRRLLVALFLTSSSGRGTAGIAAGQTTTATLHPATETTCSTPDERECDEGSDYDYDNHGPFTKGSMVVSVRDLRSSYGRDIEPISLAHAVVPGRERRLDVIDVAAYVSLRYQRCHGVYVPN